MAYKGILELTGVWPSAVAAVTQAGFVGVHQLTGVWISGGYEAAAEIDLHTPGYYGVDGIIARRDKEEEEIIALLMAMYETIH